MGRERLGWVRVLSAAGLLFAGGCFATIENGLDMMLSIRADDVAQIAPYLGVAGPALLFGRFLNLLD